MLASMVTKVDCLALSEDKIAKKADIARRRRFHLLQCLPVGAPCLGYVDNDLATGSWWFVIGSVISTLAPIVPLLDNELHFFDEGGHDGELSAANDPLAWICLLLTGVFLTIGSYLFVRAFSEPPMPAMGRHLQDYSWGKYLHCFRTDEILAAWLFLLSSLPPLPYAMVYWTRAPTRLPYLLGLLAALSSAVCAGLFVYAVYLPYATPPGEEGTDRLYSSDSGLASLGSTPIPSNTGSERSTPIPEHEEVEPSAVSSASLHRVLATHGFLPSPMREGNETAGKKPRYSNLPRTDKGLSLQSVLLAGGNDEEKSLQTVDIGLSTGSSSHTHHSNNKQRRQASPFKTKLLIPTVERMIGKHSPILIHVSTDFLLASWVLFFVSVAWTMGSIWLLLLKVHEANARLDYVYATSLADSIPFAIGCIYYISGGYYVSQDGVDDDRDGDDDNDDEELSVLSNPLHVSN